MTDLTRLRWQHRLKLQSSQIEATLRRWDLPGRIIGGHIHHPWTCFTFDKPPFPILGQLDTDALCHDLQQALGVPVAQWRQQDGHFDALSVGCLTLAIQQPVIPAPLLTMMIDYPEHILHETVLGCTERQTNLTWRLTHPHSSHVIATGSPGAGTTDLLLSQGMALAWTHTPQQVRLLLLDGGEETPSPLTPLLDLLHTLKLAQGETAVRWLHTLLLASVRPPAFACWPVLAHAPLRLVGCVSDTVTAAYLTGQPHSQAEQLLGGGDFLAIAPGLFTHFQAASLDRYDWSFCLQELGQELERELELEGRLRPMY